MTQLARQKHTCAVRPNQFSTFQLVEPLTRLCHAMVDHAMSPERCEQGPTSVSKANSLV